MMAGAGFPFMDHLRGSGRNLSRGAADSLERASRFGRRMSRGVYVPGVWVYRGGAFTLAAGILAWAAVHWMWCALLPLSRANAATVMWTGTGDYPLRENEDACLEAGLLRSAGGDDAGWCYRPSLSFVRKTWGIVRMSCGVLCLLLLLFIWRILRSVFMTPRVSGPWFAFGKPAPLTRYAATTWPAPFPIRAGTRGTPIGFRGAETRL